MYLRPGLIVVIVGITLTSLSTLVVALRYYCRFFKMGSVGATDHLMFVALVLTWGNTVVNYYQDQSSNYRPSWNSKPSKRPFVEKKLHGTLITWYVYRMTYGVALCFVKLSILFFYRALASRQNFRRVVNSTIGIVIAYTVATTLASAFQCENPADAYDISGYLHQFDKSIKIHHSKCFDPAKLWIFCAAVNLFTDVLIVALPIPTLLALKVPMSKRLALIGIFSVGMIGIVASCVRTWVIALWSESAANSAKFGPDLLLWGQVETNAGIISASVPFLRLFFCAGRVKETEKGVGFRKPRGRREVGPIGVAITPPGHVKVKDGTNWGYAGSKRAQIDSMAFFDGEKNENNEKNEKGGPVWKPFITVPASLTSTASVSDVEDQKEYYMQREYKEGCYMTV